MRRPRVSPAAIVAYLVMQQKQKNPEPRARHLLVGVPDYLRKKESRLVWPASEAPLVGWP